MEKYSGLKTIGDGTYGSVVKAMNMKTGKHFPSLTQLRWDCGNQEDEEEVSEVGLMCSTQRDPIPDQALASKYCSALRSHIGEEHSSLCVWVLRHEYLLGHEG